jgi:hypothetical protein
MNLNPFDWNVVIVGYWNRAILTPAGIGRRLFGLEEGTPVLVEVPMDGLGPHRVKYSDLTVTAETGRLVVHADIPKYDLLDRARKAAILAMKSLPETPLIAAGFNVRVRIKDPSDELLTSLTSGLDNALSDAGFEIYSRSLRRKLKFKDGTLNLDVEEGDDFRVIFNFDRQSSKKEDLIAWLQLPIAEIEDVVSSVFEKVLRTKLEGVGE